MENKWLLYEKTLQNIHNNQKIFMNMLIYYYKLVIIDKHNNKEYIKENYPKQNIGHLDLFNEYIVETKNLGIFTIFNNIPDVIHPLDDKYYTDYGIYISFINPQYIKKSEKDDILILDKNIWKYNKYKDIFQYQDVAPYNNYKKYVYLNIKYFDFKKYKNYLIIVVNDTNDIYSIENNIIKKKIKNDWKVVKDNNILDNKNLIYACILRKISKEDILNVFNTTETVKKDTIIYSIQSRKMIDNNITFTFYTLDKDEDLYDAFKTYKYDKDDIIYLYHCKVNQDLDFINITKDILSNNRLNKIKLTDINKLLELDNAKLPINVKDYSNYIYDGNLNYILDKEDPKLIFYENNGKRLLHEIIYKSSNFIYLKLYYFDVLNKYSITKFINSYGYYNKLNKFYKYELAFYDIKEVNDNIEIVKIEDINIAIS